MTQLHKAIAVEPGSELEQYILARAAKNFYNRSNAERFDLFPFYSILVTAGVTNKNSDAFDVWETYQARHSPLDKPVNLGHDQKRIVGHIMDCIAVDDELKPLPENLERGDLPEKLHLITSSVIYKIWEDPKVQAEINEVLDKITKGQIFVSMEALFTNFDFLLTNASTGERKILPRNKETASLTKFLRQYKGPGKIYDYVLARVLRNITFSAVGIVDKPANPDSIISNNLDLFSNTEKVSASEPVYINIDCSIKEPEIIMAEEKVEAKVDEVTPSHDYASLKDDNDNLKKDNAHLHSEIEKLNAKVAELTSAVQEKNEVAMAKDVADKKDDDDDKVVADLKETISKLEAKVAELETSKAELAKANDAMDATINEFKKASRHSDRAEAIMAVDSTLTREQALQSVARYDDLSNEGFATMLDMIKGYASRTPKEVTAESVMATAKAEKDAQYGGSPENELSKTSADIKNWFSKTKVKKES